MVRTGRECTEDDAHRWIWEYIRDNDFDVVYVDRTPEFVRVKIRKRDTKEIVFKKFE